MVFALERDVRELGQPQIICLEVRCLCEACPRKALLSCTAGVSCSQLTGEGTGLGISAIGHRSGDKAPQEHEATDMIDPTEHTAEPVRPVTFDTGRYAFVTQLSCCFISI